MEALIGVHSVYGDRDRTFQYKCGIVKLPGGIEPPHRAGPEFKTSAWSGNLNSKGSTVRAACEGDAVALVGLSSTRSATDRLWKMKCAEKPGLRCSMHTCAHVCRTSECACPIVVALALSLPHGLSGLRLSKKAGITTGACPLSTRPRP